MSRTANAPPVASATDAARGTGRGGQVRLGAVAFIAWDDPIASAAAGHPAQEVAVAGGEVIQTLERLVLAWFESASGCVRCCAALRGAGCRAGLSVGDVLLEGALLHGLPVIEASRLKDLARANQVLCTARLARLAALPPDASTPLGEVRLKGIDQPVAVVELV